MLKSDLPGSGVVYKRTGQECHPGMDNAKVTEVYFKQLDDADLVALHAIYADDFRMFGYESKRGSLTFPM